MIGRDLAGQARHWCLLVDHGGHPAVRLAADVLGLTPLLELRLDLGEGANALAALPLLRSVLALAGALPAHPHHGGTDGDGSDATPTEPTDPAVSGGDVPDVTPEFAEPQPAGPGPTTTSADPNAAGAQQAEGHDAAESAGAGGTGPGRGDAGRRAG